MDEPEYRLISRCFLKHTYREIKLIKLFEICFSNVLLQFRSNEAGLHFFMIFSFFVYYNSICHFLDPRVLSP